MTIIEAEKDYFLRILIADVVRELLFNGAEPEAFARSPASRKIVRRFPQSQSGNTSWMTQILEYLDQIDVARPKHEECGDLATVGMPS